MNMDELSWIDPTTPVGDLTTEQLFVVLKGRCRRVILITDAPDEDSESFISFYAAGDPITLLGMMRLSEKQLTDSEDTDD
jgi:CRP-like cAMP-binding protein